MKDVSFKYKKSTQYILRGINLSIKKGESIGIVGKTGVVKLR